jgi:hypothetical protein
MQSVVEGTVRNLRNTQEGTERVLRCVLVTDDERAFAVEMRGHELRGVINEGDRVNVQLDVAGRGEDRTLRPRELTNVTTGGLVQLRPLPLLRRAVRPFSSVLTAAVSAVVGALVAAVIAATGWSASRRQGDAPFEQDGGSDVVLFAALAVVVLVGLAAALLLRRRSGMRPALAAFAFVAGFALVVVLVVVS